MADLILRFLKIPKIFICVQVRQGTFSSRTENVIRLKQYPLYIFSL